MCSLRRLPMKRFTLGLFIFLFTALPFSPNTASSEEICTALLTARCEECHYNSRICRKIGEKSKSAWKRTIKNMVHYGAKLNKNEQKSLLQCLSEPSADVVALCDNE